MKQKFLQVITSVLLIITMTIANFLLICVDVVSYAADAINADKSTNHKNVEFMAYFKDENGNKVIEKDEVTNGENLKLYFEISVNREGYFNGNILLKDTNFALKADILSDSVNKIENGTIYLNQIKAGETKEIEVNIEILRDEKFDLKLIDLNSKISIEGIYRDRTEKDILIKAEKDVKLNLVSPYTDENVILSQNIVTNKIFEINGKNKRIIQVEIKSGLDNNLYPINNSKINVQAPKISDKYPESAIVNVNDVLVTNGSNLANENWNYDENSGLLTIDIENKENDGKVSWKKSGTDTFIVTYVFDEKVEIAEEKISANSEIKLYDTKSTIIKASNEIILNSEEKDAIVTSEIIQNETSIYKGKLYAGVSRDIKYKNIINVNLNNVANTINIEENKQTIGDKVLKSVYRTTKINKSNVDNILGENGVLNIINAANGEVISTINKDTKADEDGNIVFIYPENIETVKFEIKSINAIGKLEIETTKTINSLDRNIIKAQNKIISKPSVSYVINDKITELEVTESNIELKETETSVDLEINRTELSAMVTNNNVEFRMILNSREENQELFKNPVLRLELPEKIKDIQVNYIKLLDEDELKIKSASLKGNVVEILLEGQQTKYKEEAIKGAMIVINANLTTDTKIPNSTEKVKLSYSNENAVNYRDDAKVEKDINIISYVGVVTTNQISEYGIDIVNNNGTEIAELAVSDSMKNVTIEKKIINNKENKISDVRILGTFPTKAAIDTNNINIQVGNITISGIDSNKVKVYYSSNENATEDLENKENAWKENIEDNKVVKKYLVVINELDLYEELDLSYEISIPSNLEYNESAEEGYIVYYNNVTVEEQVKTKSIKLSTPAGTVVETTMKGLIAGKETNTVKENEVLRYEMTVANTGSMDVSNVKVEANIPEGTVFVNSDKINNALNIGDAGGEVENDSSELKFIDENKKKVEFNIENLPSGKETKIYYEVQVKKGMTQKEITNTVITHYGDVSKNSNEVKLNVEEGKLELRLISQDAENGVLKTGCQYRYIVYVTNKSEENMKNLEVKLNTNKLVNVTQMYYIDSNDKAVVANNSDSIKIPEISPNETLEIVVYTTVGIFQDNELHDISLFAAVNNGTTYNSNEINLIAKSDLVIKLNATSENNGQYVKAGDTIKYNVAIKNEGNSNTVNVVLKNWISNDVTLTKVIRNGEELPSDKYSLNIDSKENKKVLQVVDNQIEAGQSIEYQIEVIVNLLDGSVNATEVISEYSLLVRGSEIQTAKLSHILQPSENGGDTPINPDNPDNPDIPNTYKVISGFAWIDENEDGQKGIEEKSFEGMSVKLLNVTTNEFVKDSNGNVIVVTTSSTGFYSFDRVENGQYLVVFEYDNTKYGLTAFEKDGISKENNSNAIIKTINVNGEEKNVSATEIINVNEDNISNINIGLIKAKKYDLQLEKYISKVTVQNNKTVTNNYENATLVKQEIDAKQVASTMVVVEYTIKVTNKGDVSGYVKKIADYLSKDYKFNSELNKDWYQSGDDLYCTSLANEEIKPGESKEVKLTVVKQMTENNTGLVNNTAEIVSSYNELGLSDINSTEGNKVKGENDMGSADLIISIRTGQTIMAISLVIVTIFILGIAIFLLKRFIITKD